MRRPTPVFAALAVAVATALAACAPTSTTSPKDPIGYRCPGPTPGAPDRTCSQAEYEQAQRRLGQYQEAETIYLEVVAEMSRLFQSGGAMEPTPVLLDRTDGAYLRMMTGVLKDQMSRGESSRGALRARVVGQVNEPRDQMVLGLAACEDGTGIETFDRHGGSLGHGRLIALKLWFTSVNGQLKIVEASGSEDSQCGQ